MTKSAVSHGAVTIVAIIFGAILTEWLKPGLPGLYEFFHNLGVGISELINRIFGVQTAPAAFTPIFISMLIGVGWGLFYGVIRHRTNHKYGERA